MPKALRYFVKGRHYHLTHRCHNRSFLLRFAKDRDAYRTMLGERLKRFHTPLLAYCITSNHVHLLVTARSETRISEFMDSLEGDFAQRYNLRKGRSGAFWGGRFHAVAVEEGEHLWKCMVYIELNMVRAGVVKHPGEWRWCSYAELMGLRQRYRLVNRDHLGNAIGHDPGSEAFRENYRFCIDQKILAREFEREAMWTEHLAVGSEKYVGDISKEVRNRRRLESERLDQPDTETWILKEKRAEYS